MTLTRTRACARSAETWTPVTVTNPQRGSRTLPVRKAATVWRMASATRAGRWLRRCFMSEETGRRVHDAGAVGGLHQAVGLLQHPLGVPAVVRHHAHRELGALPQVVVGRLRRREDRKSTRLNSSHLVISYAVFCLKKKKRPVPTISQRSK